MSLNRYKLVDDIIRYIEDNLKEELTLDKIANEVNYSKFYINRLFAQETGSTIYKYIQRKRMEVAASQLIQTEVPIVEIAYDACYQSQQAFTQAFAQIYETTPQVYRRKNKSKISMQTFFYGYRRAA